MAKSIARTKSGQFAKKPRKAAKTAVRTVIRTVAAPVKRKVRAVAKGTVKLARKARRSYASASPTNLVKGQLIPGLVGGVGAVGVNMILSRLTFLPASLQSGIARHATRAAIGIAAGMLVGKVLKQPKLGAQLAQGAITVAAYEAINEKVGSFVSVSPALVNPNVSVGEVVNGFYGDGETFDVSGISEVVQF